VPIADITEVWIERTYTPSVIHVSIGGCTDKQAMYRCYHKLISRRATFSYCQMCWLLIIIISISLAMLVNISKSQATVLTSWFCYLERFCYSNTSVLCETKLIEINSLLPTRYNNYFTPIEKKHLYYTRGNKQNLHVLWATKTCRYNSLRIPGRKYWNKWPYSLKIASSYPIFKSRLIEFLLNQTQ